MASMNTRLNIEKLDGNIIQKNGGSKQVGFKQLGPGVETRVHGVHNEIHVWFKVELQGAQGDRKAERSTQQCMKSGVAKYLGVTGIQQHNGMVDETNVTLFAKVRCFLIQSGLSKVFWAEDTTRSTYLVNRSPSLVIGFKKPIDMLGFFDWLASIKQGMLEPVKVKCILLGYHKSIVGNKLWRLDDATSKVVLYRNMGFNESGEYKKTLIGSGVAHDMEQHLACELFGYREDSNEDAFAVAVVEKFYAHESLTFNNTVACDVISKWKARLKDDMDARSDVYVLSNGCRRSSKDSHDYYWEYALGKCTWFGDHQGLEWYTLRVSPSRIHNEKLVQTLLKGHSTLSLEDSLSRDCDVEKNDFDYAMRRSITVMSRSITGYRLMILGCAGSLKDNLQHMEALSTTKAGYMTFTEAWKKEIWLKGLLVELGYELSLVAGIAAGALVKGGSRSEVPAQVEVAAYRY
ncbi:zinc finger, CCHC-type containing protein [Tanacetum coccineum]|uniref:Zinc finger, CCHC-type containing protein n=1 Tax=Tanacetum coccineum TaxID=301880 RepID=A0ABQ5BX95_9ASTR